MSDTGGGHRASAAALTAALSRHAGAAAVAATTVDLFVDVAGWPLVGVGGVSTHAAAVQRSAADIGGARARPPASGPGGGGGWRGEGGGDGVPGGAVAPTGPPDVIVSVHPLAQSAAVTALRMLAEAEAAGASGGGGLVPTPPVPGLLRPLLTVVTDLGAAHPLWFTPAATRVYSPSAAVSDVAVAEGVPASRLRRYGLPVRQAFWELNGGAAGAKQDPTEGGTTPDPAEGGSKPDAASATIASDPPSIGDAAGAKAALRCQLGLHPTAPAVLLVGGGDGVGGLRRVVPAVVDRLAETLGPTGAQVVVVCGRNERLRSSFARRTWALTPAAVDSSRPLPRAAAEGQQERCHGSPDAAAVATVDSGSGGGGDAAGGVIVLGFVSNMADYMRAADMLITKAGPGTIAEALICRLPILLCAYLPGQETGNVTYVVDHGVGAYESAPARIADTAAEWAASPSLRAAMAARAGALAAPDAALRIAEDIWAVAVASRAARAGAAEVAGGGLPAATAAAARGWRRRRQAATNGEYV
ncbi:hypothetical protein MMPV_003410 [Pyropia vietnamensis]